MFLCRFHFVCIKLKKGTLQSAILTGKYNCLWVSRTMADTSLKKSLEIGEMFFFSLKIPSIFYLQSMNFASKSLNTQIIMKSLVLQNFSSILGSNCKWNIMKSLVLQNFSSILSSNCKWNINFKGISRARYYCSK